METYQDNSRATFEFSVGSVLGRTFSTLSGCFGLFVGLTFIAFLLQLLCYFLLRSIISPTSLENVENFVSLIINSMTQGAVAYGVFQVLRGSDASIGESLSRGFSRIVSLFFTSILEALALMACFIAGALMMAAFHSMIPIVLSSVLVVAILCMWAVAIPCCVVEHMGPVESLRRSAQLTRGYRGRIFAVLLLGFLTLGAIGWLVSRFTSDPFIAQVFALLIRLIPQAFLNVMISIIYYDLRTVKEGVSLDSLADVFD